MPTYVGIFLISIQKQFHNFIIRIYIILFTCYWVYSRHPYRYIHFYTMKYIALHLQCASLYKFFYIVVLYN